jgi:hypothetical protein
MDSLRLLRLELILLTASLFHAWGSRDRWHRSSSPVCGASGSSISGLLGSGSGPISFGAVGVPRTGAKGAKLSIVKLKIEIIEIVSRAASLGGSWNSNL